jgi:biotin operon repressor
VTHATGGREISSTARALLTLEAIQNTPGVTAQRLGERLGVTERAARRYVAILREAGLPIESATGPYGGYPVGRGMRLPPLTFSAAEAAGLVMAVLEGHRTAADPADLVGGALAKIIRVLPDTFTTPPGLDSLRVLEEHLSQGWKFPVDVLVDAPPAEVAWWLPRSLGALSPAGEGQTRLLASTDTPDWYAGRLAALPYAFQVKESPQLRDALAELGRRLLAAGTDSATSAP